MNISYDTSLINILAIIITILGSPKIKIYDSHLKQDEECVDGQTTNL